MFPLRIRRAFGPTADASAELAALADGSLAGERRRLLEARVAASPLLAARVAEQESAVALIREAGASVAAPATLRARVEARRRHPQGTRGLALGVSSAAAVGAVAVLLAWPGGSGPTVAAAAELAARPATGPPPARTEGRRYVLELAVSGLAFPAWEALGWKAVGVRTDRLAGRRSDTVFYRRQRWLIGYTVVDGALPAPRGAATVVRRGTVLRSFTEHGRLVVTWLRNGRTCVLSARAVDRVTLLALASRDVT